jgi:ubiquinone/menaquinone biosynthesis C-methylase UbiE
MKPSNDYENALRQHYRRPDLKTIIAEAFEKAGKTVTSYKETAALDEFHMRGRDATRELARLAELSPGTAVLDLGCALGGPARLLAAEFDCRVTGIDVMAEYIEAAEMLTRMAGLAERVNFRTGNMLEMPFDDRRFDLVWSQHTFMNIEDKAHLFGEIRRVLRPGGRLAFYEVMGGPNAPVHYPVQWASDPAIDFLVPEAQMIDRIEAAGFEKLHWQDMSAECSAWFESVVARMGKRAKDAPPPLALNLVIGKTTAEKARNTARNLKEERIRVVYGVWRVS